MTLAGSFADPTLPAGFAPFNIQNVGGQLFDGKTDGLRRRGEALVGHARALGNAARTEQLAGGREIEMIHFAAISWQAAQKCEPSADGACDVP